MRAFLISCRWMAAVAGAIGLGALLMPLAAVTPAHADATFEFRGEAAPSAARSKRTSSGNWTASKRTTSGRKAARQSRQRVAYGNGRSKRMSLGAPIAQEHRESLAGGSKRISRHAPSRKLRTGKRDRTKRPALRTASLGDSYVPKPEVGRSLTGGGVKWIASSGCLNSGLRAVLYQVASTFGPVTVNSTCRGRRHNARVGGARHSHHLSGNAVDFRVSARNLRAVYSFLRTHASVGGLKLYRRGFFHIDTGSRRTW